MGKSVAPKERVNVEVVNTVGDAQVQQELPMRLMMLGDYTQRPDDRPLDEREPIKVTKDTFADVMGGQGLSLTFAVEDRLTGQKDSELPVQLKISSLKDFEPQSVVGQVPELKKLLELRRALQALKGPLGNLPAFKTRMKKVLGDPDTVNKLLDELGITGAADERAGAGDEPSADAPSPAEGEPGSEDKTE